MPLVGRMVEILREQEAARPEGHSFVFPGQKAKRPLDNGAVHDLLHRMEVDAVAHGFRSTFRDWAGDARSANMRSRTRSRASKAITGAAAHSKSGAD